MKNPLRLRRNVLALLLAFGTGTSLLAALTPTEWSHRQALTVAAPGLTRVAVPAATFDAAQPNLTDLRLTDPAGQEVPYFLEYDPTLAANEARSWFNAKNFHPSPANDTTQLVFETGTSRPLDALELETSVPYFLKAAHIEISSDGVDWQSLGPAVPVFRQFGAEQLQLPLNGRIAAFVRVTLDDFHSRQVAFTGAKLLPAFAQPTQPVLAPFGARITRRDEFAGETVLTVTLDGRHVSLARLGLAVKDPLFMRRVTVTVREARGSVSEETTIASGTLYRVALEGVPVRAQLDLPVEFMPRTRELLVHISNGDSPPLTLDGVEVRQHPVSVLFLASAAGRYTLLSGNPQATAPRYDLAAFGGEMRKGTAAAVVPGELEDTPNYHPRESLAEAPLPDIPLTGAPLDAKDWTERRAIMIDRSGVQELELDLEALAKSRPDYADLRVLREGNQIPYVLELPALSRSLMLTPVVAPDAKRPSVSVWQLKLPQAGAPLRRLVLASSTPLFQREFRIYEKFTTAEGGAYEITLASGNWSRTPEPGVPETRLFELSQRAQADTLWIETDNGDNPAVVLGAVQVVYPVARLIFKVADTTGFELIYGNPTINAPRYDLSLVASKLLTSSRNVAKLAAGEPASASTPAAFAGLKGGVIFWAALAVVVIVLLVIVAKLLPKPPAA